MKIEDESASNVESQQLDPRLKRILESPEEYTNEEVQEALCEVNKQFKGNESGDETSEPKNQNQMDRKIKRDQDVKDLKIQTA